MFSPIKLAISGFYIGVTSLLPVTTPRSVKSVSVLLPKIADSFSQFLRTPTRAKKHIYFLLPIGIGALIGLKLTAGFIAHWLLQYPQPMYWFLIGLVTACIPDLLQKPRHMRMTPTKFVAFVTPFLIIMSLYFVMEPTQFGTIQAFSGTKLIISGILISVAAAIPGSSATPLLMLIGTYSTLISSITSLNIAVITTTAIGAFIGSLFAAKLISYWSKRAPAHTQYAIIGTIIGYTIPLYPGISLSIEGLINIIPLLIGYGVTRQFSYLATGPTKSNI